MADVRRVGDRPHCVGTAKSAPPISRPVLGGIIRKTERQDGSWLSFCRKIRRSSLTKIIRRMNTELMSDLLKLPGVAHALCVQVAEDGIVISVICDSEESLERAHQEVGSPWVGQNLSPYLASTDRKTGPIRLTARRTWLGPLCPRGPRRSS